MSNRQNIVIRLLLVCLLAPLGNLGRAHEKPDVVDEVLVLSEQYSPGQNEVFLGHLRAAYQLELERDPANTELKISLALIDLTRITQIINLDERHYLEVVAALRTYKDLADAHPDALNGTAIAISENIERYLAPAPYSFSNGNGFLNFLRSLKTKE